MKYLQKVFMKATHTLECDALPFQIVVIAKRSQYKVKLSQGHVTFSYVQLCGKKGHSNVFFCLC